MLNRALSIIQRLLKGHYAKAIEVSVLEDLKLFLQEVAEPLTAVASDIIKLTDDLVSLLRRNKSISF